MCQVVQEKCVEGLWSAKSVDAAETLSSGCSLSTSSLPLAPVLTALQCSCWKQLGAAATAKALAPSPSCLPCLTGVEGTLPHKVQWPLQGWPKLGTPTVRTVTWSLKSSVTFCWFVSIVLIVLLPLLRLQSMFWAAVCRQSYHLSR